MSCSITSVAQTRRVSSIWSGAYARRVGAFTWEMPFFPTPKAWAGRFFFCAFLMVSTTCLYRENYSSQIINSRLVWMIQNKNLNNLPIQCDPVDHIYSKTQPTKASYQVQHSTDGQSFYRHSIVYPGQSKKNSCIICLIYDLSPIKQSENNSRLWPISKSHKNKSYL